MTEHGIAAAQRREVPYSAYISDIYRTGACVLLEVRWAETPNPLSVFHTAVLRLEPTNAKLQQGHVVWWNKNTVYWSDCGSTPRWTNRPLGLLSADLDCRLGSLRELERIAEPSARGDPELVTEDVGAVVKIFDTYLKSKWDDDPDHQHACTIDSPAYVDPDELIRQMKPLGWHLYNTKCIRLAVAPGGIVTQYRITCDVVRA